MPDAPPTSHQDRLSRLVAELRKLRHRGGPARVFDDLEDNGPLDLPVLFGIVPCLHPEEWANENLRTEAIRQVLEDAIMALPTHGLPGASEKSLSWQDAAFILFNVRVPEKVGHEIQDYDGRESARLSRYVREACAIYPLDEETKLQYDREFQNIVLKMRKLMAARIFKLVRDGDDGEPDKTRDEAMAGTDEHKEKEQPTTANQGSKFSLDLRHNQGEIAVGDQTIMNQRNFYGKTDDEAKE